MPPPAEGFAARLVLGPALRTQPDRRLVTLVRDGYETAFEEIMRRYGKPLTRYAAAIVGGRAEDVTQDAFSKALLALRREGAEIDLRPWLFRIVRNTALNDLRDRPPSSQELAESLIGGGGNPAEELERREELADLIERLRALPEPQRAAIVMRELEGLSHEEIAAALGLSGGGARQAIYRARRTLRDGLGMLLPLPLLKALLAGSAAGPIEAAAGAAGVGGAGAAGIGGAAGASVALKAATATVLVAGAVGAGVAIHDGGHGEGPAKAQAAPVASAESRPRSGSTLAATGAGEGDTADGSHGSGPSDRGARSGRDGSGSGRGSSGSTTGEDGGSGGDGSSHHSTEGGRGPRKPSDDHSGGGGATGGGSEHHSGSSGPSGDEGTGQVSDGGSLGSGDGGSGGGDSGSDSGSDSNSGPGPGGEGSESGGDSSDSGDSGDAEGLTVQMEQPTEEAK